MKNFLARTHLALGFIAVIGFALRFWHDASAPLLALASTASVPLAFVAAQAWANSKRIGLFAALFMALMPTAVQFGTVSITHAAAPALVWWSIWQVAKDDGQTRANKPSFLRKPGLFALPSLVPALLVVLMGGAGHLSLQWPDTTLLMRGLSALTFAHRVGEVALVVLVLVIASAALGCIAPRLIHQKEFAVKRCALPAQGLGLPLMMIALALIAAATFISPVAFDSAAMVAVTPALVMLLAWSFEGLILEPRAQLPGPPTPETQSQRYGLVAIAALAFLAVYWRV